MKILNFGSCNIDYVYSVDHIVVPGETTASSALELFCGGKGLNQSIALARAGVAVYHAGCIGSDGKMLLDILRENRVDTTNIRVVSGQSGHAIIQVNKAGENSILLYGGANRQVTAEFIDEVLAQFSPGDFLLLQNEISNLGYLIEKAYSLGMKIVFNPAPFEQYLNDIDCSMLYCLILNEVEAQGFTGKAEPREALAYFSQRYPELKVVLTLGKQGCIYADRAKILHHPAFQVEAVDTTAAGDTFIGYFLAALARNVSCEAALRRANAAAALTVSRKGAAPSIPFEEEVRQMLPRLQANTADRKTNFKQKLERFLDENLADARLYDFARKMGYSESHTGELVRQYTGKTFSELLWNKRCAVAAQCLRETDMPVEEIITGIGCQNESFFRKKFRAVYDMTPHQYRKTQR